MNELLCHIIPKLQPFNIEEHYTRNFLNHEWVLIHGIAKTKAIYIFKDDHTLTIESPNAVINTQWEHVISNRFLIRTEDGPISYRVYYKDEDLMVLNHNGTSDYVFFVNSSTTDMTIDSETDLRSFLKQKYEKRAADLIAKHQFYYLERSKEFGPFTVDELSKRVKYESLNSYCFVRDINDYDYTKKIRIRDLMNAI